MRRMSRLAVSRFPPSETWPQNELLPSTSASGNWRHPLSLAHAPQNEVSPSPSHRSCPPAQAWVQGRLYRDARTRARAWIDSRWP